MHLTKTKFEPFFQFNRNDSWRKRKKIICENKYFPLSSIRLLTWFFLYAHEIFFITCVFLTKKRMQKFRSHIIYAYTLKNILNFLKLLWNNIVVNNMIIRQNRSNGRQLVSYKLTLATEKNIMYIYLSSYR